MINRNRAILKQCIIHKVGNKFNTTKNTFSKDCIQFDEEGYELMLPFLLKSFGSLTESYRFHHHADIALNEMNIYAQNIFEDRNTFKETSENIVKHLYEQSNSSNIKTGEVLVVYFEELIYEERPVEAIGVFKIENKIPFFQVFNNDNNDIDIVVQKGISSKKIDKGCLILNTKDSEGNVVLSVDNNNYDTQYWQKQFLNVQYADNKNLHTQQYIALCKEFSEEVLKENKGSKAQAEFLAQSIEYFTENEFVNINEFVTEIFEDESLQHQFRNYKEEYEEEKSILVNNAFEMSAPVLIKERKKLKSEIKLDTNIQIKLDVNDPDTASENLEEGYDEDRKMKFYKVYFNEEV